MGVNKSRGEEGVRRRSMCRQGVDDRRETRRPRLLVPALLSVLALWNVAPWRAAAESTRVTMAEPANELALAVDRILEQRWESEEYEPQFCDDAAFLRRVSLDLIGMLPSVVEVRAFLADSDPAKRNRVVDRLLSSPLHASHLANQWTSILLSDAASDTPQDRSQELHNWLRERFGRNMRYDRLVADLLAAAGSGDVGPMAFYQAQDFQPEKLATSSARIFLGMQLGCAQCHDHPFDIWAQKDFWGYAAFFAQVESRSTSDGMSMILADRAQGDVTLPDTKQVVLPQYPDLERTAADLNSLGTRRQWLALWMASPDNPYLGRAAANRVWGQLFGRGLVHPVDDLGPRSSGLDPELLQTLADGFVASGYDLTFLLRGIVSSQAYQLSSRTPNDPDAPTDCLHVMPVRPLTADQLFDSLRRNLTVTQLSPTAPLDAASVDIARLDASRAEFRRQFRSISGDGGTYQAGVQQALSLMNGQLTRQLADEATARLVWAVEAPFLDMDQQLETIFLATVSRPPTPAERQRIVAPGAERLSREEASDLVWVLLNSAEFMFNH